MSLVILTLEPNATDMFTSSWGRGTREVQFPTVDQLPPAVVCHVCVAEGVGAQFVPLFPPQSPTDVPVHVGVPPQVMSWQSTLVRVTAAAVMVRGVPTVSDLNSILLTTVFPVTVTVPETVTVPLRFSTPAVDAGPVCVRFAMEQAGTVAVVVPLKFSDAPFRFVTVSESVTVEPEKVNVPVLAVTTPAARVRIVPDAWFSVTMLLPRVNTPPPWDNQAAETA